MLFWLSTIFYFFPEPATGSCQPTLPIHHQQNDCLTLSSQPNSAFGHLWAGLLKAMWCQVRLYVSWTLQVCEQALKPPRLKPPIMWVHINCRILMEMIQEKERMHLVLSYPWTGTSGKKTVLEAEIFKNSHRCQHNMVQCHLLSK